MSRRAVHICFAGPEHRIVVGAITFIFEMHNYFGPVPLKPSGESRDLLPRSPFWRAVSLWIRQGKKLDERGVCIWRQPTPTKARVVDGRLVIVEASDDEEMCRVIEIVDDEGTVVRTVRKSGC